MKSEHETERDRKLRDDFRKAFEPKPGDFELLYGDMLKRCLDGAFKVKS